MGKNWLRTYTMMCGPPGGEGFLIGNTDSAEQTVLHIAFSIEKSDSETTNNGKVTVWNLSKENRALLESKDCGVVLRAGYGKEDALILQGNIVSSKTTREDADIVTEAEVVDGRVALRDTALSISLTGTVNTRDIYELCASNMGMSVVYSASVFYKLYQTGFSFVGKTSFCLDKVTEYNGHNWTIQNGVLQITAPGEPVNTHGYVMSRETGLIGVPKRITIDSATKGKKSGSSKAAGTDEAKESGYEIEYFLNGAIGINDIVIMKTDTINGYFRVRKLTIEGDNLDGDWTCTAQIVEIGQ